MIPISAPLPIRTTVAWGQFRDAEPIPHRFGSTNGPLIQYDDGRRVWVWADHASAGISLVTIEGQPVANWSWYNAQDRTGRPVTFVEFTDALDEGVTPIAHGIGKVHARTGAPIENPADVLWDVLANMAGQGTDQSAFAEFRDDCARRGIRVAGSISEGSAQAACVEVCRSIGAVFAPTAQRRAFFWPGAELELFDSVTVDGRWDASADAQLDSVSNVVIVNFDPLDGAPRQSVEIEAPTSVAEFGRHETTIAATWCRDARTAVDLAQRILADSARMRWSVRASATNPVTAARPLRPGHVALLAHPELPIAGRAVILSVQTTPDDGQVALSFLVPDGAPPATRIVRQSFAISPMVYASASVQTQGSERILVLKDDDGRAIANARVVLDGAIERFSDAGGRVVFPASVMPPGAHTLAITTDSAQFELQVIVP